MDAVKAKRIALVTGTLAEPALRRVAAQLAATCDIDLQVIVLNIQVAALMTADWVGRKLQLPADEHFDRVLLTGYVRGDVAALSQKLGTEVQPGPKDLLDLPQMFGMESKARAGYGQYDIEIIAEINDAPLLSTGSILVAAEKLRLDGADVIDIGCEPGIDRAPWPGLAEVVRELSDQGFRVSIDTMHQAEIEAGCAAGAQLVLSINSTNRQVARDIDTEVVAIPDDPKTLAGLDDTIAYLTRHDVRFRVDPIIEPIGFGFAQSLGRYLEVRKRYGDVTMMMGTGNLSEMTQVDSAGVNMLLIGFCQELGIHSVLTTQVINYARSSVAEIDVARRLCRHAVNQQMPPKHLDDRLVILRDERLREQGEQAINHLAQKLTDRNFRIFAERGQIHVMNKDVHLRGDDPFKLFKQIPDSAADPAHAFYLGFEMAKALTALTLHKNYVQDQPLDWGLLNVDRQDEQP